LRSPILRSSHPDRTLFGMAVYRYPRLTVPMLASSLIAWALLSSGAFHLHEIAHHQANATWWLELYDFPARFPTMLEYALWDVYAPNPPSHESWNIVLWTMPIELQGSFLIFALLAIVRWRRLRVPLAFAVAILEVGTGMYGYLVGHLALYLALIDVLPYGLVVALVGGLSLPAALAACYVFTLVVEEGTLRGSSAR
jgi:peptidoglycan/LPS O-acetylase OafA/YrhL